MPLPAPGSSISLSQIRNTIRGTGGSAALSEFYAGGAGGVLAGSRGIPSSPPDTRVSIPSSGQLKFSNYLLAMKPATNDFVTAGNFSYFVPRDSGSTTAVDYIIAGGGGCGGGAQGDLNAYAGGGGGGGGGQVLTGTANMPVNTNMSVQVGAGGGFNSAGGASGVFGTGFGSGITASGGQPGVFADGYANPGSDGDGGASGSGQAGGQGAANVPTISAGGAGGGSTSVGEGGSVGGGEAVGGTGGAGVSTAFGFIGGGGGGGGAAAQQGVDCFGGIGADGGGDGAAAPNLGFGAVQNGSAATGYGGGGGGGASNNGGAFGGSGYNGVVRLVGFQYY